jgi:hypothetical protein
MAKLDLDMPPEHWETVLPFLHHQIGHMDSSPLEPDPKRVLKQLEDAIRSQFSDRPPEVFIPGFHD